MNGVHIEKNGEEKENFSNMPSILIRWSQQSFCVHITNVPTSTSTSSNSYRSRSLLNLSSFVRPKIFLSNIISWCWYIHKNSEKTSPQKRAHIFLRASRQPMHPSGKAAGECSEKHGRNNSSFPWFPGTKPRQKQCSAPIENGTKLANKYAHSWHSTFIVNLSLLG